MDTNEIVTEVMNNEEEIVDTNTGIKCVGIVAGIGVGIIVGRIVYKKVIKPLIAKRKNKREGIEDESTDVVDTECDVEDAVCGDE